jgi:phosphotransferase family enzyme
MTLTYGLTVDTVAGYLRGRRVMGPAPVVAEPLLGGVSNEVLAVTGDGVDLVVKQALRRLRVEQEWTADPRRILTEAASLLIAAKIRPDDVPTVLDVDESAMTLTLGRADRSLRNWKDDLLAGTIDPRTGERLAAALAAWHTATEGRPQLRDEFGTAGFVELRIDPFHRVVARRHPTLARRIDELADSLLTERLCLVHGDFSPKNVLAAGNKVCVLDWEVAHYGDPVFDLAFLQAHLVLKAVHRPADRDAYRSLAIGFLDEYGALVDTALRRPDDYLAAQTACLLLARVDGKSPAAYLTPPERDRVRDLAVEMLTGRPGVVELWDGVDG